MNMALAPLSAPPVVAPHENWQDGLTAKQCAFVEHYVRWRNATQAYDAAYDARGGSYETRRDEGSKVLARPEIKAAIAIRSRIATEESGHDVLWLLQRFLDMSTADPRELIGLKIGCCRFCHGEGHGYQWREREYLEQMKETEWLVTVAQRDHKPTADIKYPDFAGGFGFNATRPPHPDCPQCHGEGVERVVPRDSDKFSDQALLLFGGVKRKADGSLEIIIADRQKAAELAGRIMGAFKDNIAVGGLLRHAHALADLRDVPQDQAAKMYQDFIAGKLAA
jgi:phage terminase small subunit